jgi:hypothetical protein
MTISCGTCRFWDPRYPENRDLGVCQKAGVIVFSREAAIVMKDSLDETPPTSDYVVVRTTRAFGCVQHTPFGAFVRTLELVTQKIS